MRFSLGRPPVTPDPTENNRSALAIGVVGEALGAPERLVSLAALFPQVSFEPAPADWATSKRKRYAIVLVHIDAKDGDAAAEWLRRTPEGTRVVVLLKDADVTTSRRLLREGAADVLPAPANEAALALSLERLLAANLAAAAPEQTGRVIALLKAGGGVGATSLGVQMAILAAQQAQGGVCFADFDLQFGAAAVYMDLPDSLNVADILASGTAIAETQFSTMLPRHPSGASLLAAPREMMALDAVSPAQADGFVQVLRRDYAQIYVDLPPAWTEWSSQIVQGADAIILITHLSVPHAQLVKRQLRALDALQVDKAKVVLVCNAVSATQRATLSINAAERALGRGFDMVIAEDTATMTAALNQGVELSRVRRGTKLEKALLALAERVEIDAKAQGR